MFFHRQRRSFYPLAIALLTLALGGLMFLALNKPSSAAPDANSVPAVSDSDYRAQAHAVVAPFVAAYAAAPENAAKLGAVEDALAGLLRLTVPASYKEVHLALAVDLSQIRDGLRAEGGSPDAGYEKLTKLIGDEPWLAN